MAAKTVNIPSTNYSGHIESNSLHTASWFVANSNAGTYTYVDADTFTGGSIAMSAIGNAIGSASRSLSTLCQSANINDHAMFLPNGISPYRMGDFIGYNHQAKPNTYWTSGKTRNLTIEYGTPITNLYFDFNYGEKAPQKTGGSIYHRREDIYQGSLLGIGVTVGSTPPDTSNGSTDIFEYKLANFPASILYQLTNASSGTFTVTPKYYTRTSAVRDWVASNTIEDGAGSVTVTLFYVPWVAESIVFYPTSIDLFAKLSANINIQVDFDVKNTSSTSYTRSIYWGVYDASGNKLAGARFDSETIAGNTTKSYSTPTTSVLWTRQKHYFRVTINDYWSPTYIYQIGAKEIPVTWIE